MRRKEPTCAVCGLRFSAGEPVAWTVGRDRIHESCIDLARVAAPGRAKLGPWKAHAVRLFLERSGERRCVSCFAMALHLSLDQARAVIEAVDGVAGLGVLPAACVSCGRVTASLCLMPLSGTDRLAS